MILTAIMVFVILFGTGIVILLIATLMMAAIAGGLELREIAAVAVRGLNSWSLIRR